MGDDKTPVALITGATGFVGSHLTKKLLSEGWHVYILTRSESLLPRMLDHTQVVSLIYDGNSQSLIDCVAQVRPSVVFHVASLFIAEHDTQNIESLIQSNILYGTQLLEAMRINKVKNFINTGTSWQHFNNEEYNPVCLYAATKQAFEAIIEYYVQACNMKAVTLKLFDTYGPEDQRNKLFSLLNRAAKTGEPLNMSKGEQLIDLVHIDDVVKAYVIAAKYLIEDKILHHEKYVISSGCCYTLREIVELYIQTTGEYIQVNWGVRPYRSREVMKLWKKGLSLPGWSPSIKITDGLKNIFK